MSTVHGTLRSGKVELQWPEVPGAEKYVVRRMARGSQVDMEVTTTEATDQPEPGNYIYIVLPVIDGVVAAMPCKTFRVRVGG